MIKSETQRDFINDTVIMSSIIAEGCYSILRKIFLEHLSGDQILPTKSVVSEQFIFGNNKLD